MTGRALICLGAVALVAGCAPGPAPEAAAPPRVAEGEVVETTAASGPRTFEVRLQGRLYEVDVQDLGGGGGGGGGGAPRVVVAARAPGGLESADAPLAYEVALRALEHVDCAGGQPVAIDPRTGTFEESGQLATPTRGAPAFVFKGRCGG